MSCIVHNCPVQRKVFSNKENQMLSSKDFCESLAAQYKVVCKQYNLWALKNLREITVVFH